ncbi:MAG: hypothetical protein CMJ32_03885 [Phycisphaerae bacterium]|nr:hypothetical protein [Phycisphaerae bacterium]
MSNQIPISNAEITNSDIEAVTKALRQGYNRHGDCIVRFESRIANLVDRPYAIAVNSGTAALKVALTAMGIGPGDEVLVPAFGFVDGAEAIVQLGATPVFVDCNPRTANMSLRLAEQAITSNTKAILWTETFGNPTGVEECSALCNKYEIPMIENSCGAFGGRVGGYPLGRFGRIAVFSFASDRPITTGEGGMIVTHDDRLAEACRTLRNHGRSDSAEVRENQLLDLGCLMEHERPGYSFRMNLMSAALGTSQLDRLEQVLQKRQEIADQYIRRLGGNSNLMLPDVPSNTLMSWFTFVVRLSDNFTVEDRDHIIEGFHRHEIGAANYYPVIPHLDWYRRIAGPDTGSYPAAESISQRSIALPMHNQLDQRLVDLICQTLELLMQQQCFSRE